MLKADHFAFQVSDMDNSINFYRDLLGLKLLFRETIEEHQEEIAFLEADGCNIELLRRLDDATFKKQVTHTVYCPHFAFKTDDMNETMEMIRQKQIAIVKGPLEVPGNVKWIYVSDPDGNVIEFVQWLVVD